jgi:hypothetical protein
MNWKFWRNNETAAAPNGGKTQALERPRDLPHEIGRHMVVDHGLDPDWVWSLKCVRKLRENSKNAFDIRIFSLESAAQHRVKIRDYASLDNHLELVIYAGWYDRKTPNVHLEELIKKAV